jgi:hypothetical protein
VNKALFNPSKEDNANKKTLNEDGQGIIVRLGNNILNVSITKNLALYSTFYIVSSI